jgi:hypothetical protein
LQAVRQVPLVLVRQAWVQQRQQYRLVLVLQLVPQEQRCYRRQVLVRERCYLLRVRARQLVLVQ